MKGITTDIILKIAIPILAIVIITFWFVINFGKGDVKDMLPMQNPGEISRFISYVRCSMAACIGGCNSGETIVTNVIDNDGERMSCNELLIKENYCTEYNSKKLCGEDYPLNFIFKEETVYRSDYDLDKSDDTTYKGTPCSISVHEGWNTDLSCRNNPSSLYPCPCEKCLGDIRNPYGVLFNSGVSCSSSGKDKFLGSLWLPNSFVKGNCIENGNFGSLKSCTFSKDKQIKIWTDTKNQRGTCGLVGLQCLLGSNNCPRIIICPS